MKRRILLLIAVILLCLAPAGCEAESASAEKLWVLTDLGWKWTNGGETEMSEDNANRDFQAILKYFGGLPEGMEAELEILPVEEADLDARLTRIKTEILAGGGPDVFLLSCDYALWNGRVEKLFPNPEKAMYSGFFLPLDDYIENARFLEWEKLTPAIMGAGRAEEGQLLLPFRYECNAIKLPKTALEGEPPANWDEAVSGDNQSIRKGYGLSASGTFPNVFPKIADNKTEELLVTEEELLRRVKQSLSCPDPSSEYPAAALPLLPIMNPETGEDYWETELDSSVFLPMRNTEGGVTAYITYYGAVNRNTEHPQAAFDILDMFLSKQVLREESFGQVLGSQDITRRRIYLFSNLNGTPVHEDLLSPGNSVEEESLSAEGFQALSQARSQITTAYFPSTIDIAVNEMYSSCYTFTNDFHREIKSDEEIEKLVSQTYDSIWMMLGES